MIRTIENVDTAHIDINLMRRNLQAPRDGLTPAQRATAVHAYELDKAAKWPELLMLFLAGMCAGGIIVTAIIKV